jgi:branched-chain amino acid transport system ATP-binding protein
VSELRVANLVAGYGRIRIVEDVSLHLQPGEIVALVGRNGSGKTTSLASVAGLRFGPRGGTVHVADQDVSSASAEAIVAAGLKLVSEGRRLFRELTVLENLRLGAFSRRRHFATPELEDVFEVFPILKQFIRRKAGELSGGQQQMVAIGQALMCRPKFLLLDEPTSGLAPVLIDDMYDAFSVLARQGIGLLIVDQNVERIVELASRFYVMDAGRIVLEGECTASVLEQINAVVLGVPMDILSPAATTSTPIASPETRKAP